MQASASPTKSIPTNPSSTPSAPPWLTDLTGRREEVRLTPDAPGQYTLDLTSRSSARTSTGGPLLLTLTTADGRQHTVRLLKQSDIFGE